MALLIRTRLEAGKTRTVERACLQLQALVDQCPLEEPSASERLDHFFAVLMPPTWELERELGERFVSLGLVVSALEIFKRLQLWDDVISCLQMMEKNKEAEEVVIEQLKLNPKSAKFLCLLGDLRSDIKYYEQAWEVSGFRYARAMRSLASYHFKQRNVQSLIIYTNQSSKSALNAMERHLQSTHYSTTHGSSWDALQCTLKTTTLQ